MNDLDSNKQRVTNSITERRRCVEIRINLTRNDGITDTLILTLGRSKYATWDNVVRLRFQPAEGLAVDLGLCDPCMLRNALRGLGFNA